jgi:hypothetical protein
MHFLMFVEANQLADRESLPAISNHKKLVFSRTTRKHFSRCFAASRIRLKQNQQHRRDAAMQARIPPIRSQRNGEVGLGQDPVTDTDDRLLRPVIMVMISKAAGDRAPDYWRTAQANAPSAIAVSASGPSAGLVCEHHGGMSAQGRGRQAPARRCRHETASRRRRRQHPWSARRATVIAAINRGRRTPNRVRQKHVGFVRNLTTAVWSLT